LNGTLCPPSLPSGEANPGGGKSEVERYLAKSRAEVIESAEILKTVIDILGIPGAVVQDWARVGRRM
jgi:hypothetical protein